MPSIFAYYLLFFLPLLHLKVLKGLFKFLGFLGECIFESSTWPPCRNTLAKRPWSLQPRSLSAGIYQKHLKKMLLALAHCVPHLLRLCVAIFFDRFLFYHKALRVNSKTKLVEQHYFQQIKLSSRYLFLDANYLFRFCIEPDFLKKKSNWQPKMLLFRRFAQLTDLLSSSIW